MPRKQHSYTVKVKQAALESIEQIGLTATIAELGYPHGTVDGWWRARDKLRAYAGNALSKTTKGQGRKECFPFTQTLVTFVEDTRRDEEWLTTSIMIGFIAENYEEWLEQYEEGKTSAVEKRWRDYCREQQNAKKTKLPCLDLIQIKQDFAIEFWSVYSSYSPSEIYNMDETAINFDMPPVRIWGVKGRSGSAKVQDLTKHCGRMTAVLTIRGDVFEVCIYQSAHWSVASLAGYLCRCLYYYYSCSTV
ncbi:hypothetical protein P3T76_007269 [Phytophthora citrophthora]|uniref:DDE-1 domain-containing protein n=1 Tax=Phytophthora citrophthora TaxID=4793 RepID=A0AAD9GNK3_9STRA|nr:hypothetical protein P3T76_007269 [Phytophthora citrophthora]